MSTLTEREYYVDIIIPISTNSIICEAVSLITNPKLALLVSLGVVVNRRSHFADSSSHN